MIRNAIYPENGKHGTGVVHVPVWEIVCLKLHKKKALMEIKKKKSNDKKNKNEGHMRGWKQKIIYELIYKGCKIKLCQREDVLRRIKNQTKNKLQLF